MDKVTINNQVVQMRKFVKQAKVHAINKLNRQAKLLQNRKGSDVQIQKARRKAERFLEEIKILKTMKPDHVSKMALLKAKDWNEILKQKSFELEERCLAILANYPAVQNEVENFHSANPSLICKIPNYFKEWEEKNKLPKELRKNKNVLKSSNFTDVNKSDLNLKNAQKRGKLDSTKANIKTKNVRINIGTPNNDTGKKLKKAKIDSETKSNKQSSDFLENKRKLLHKNDLSEKKSVLKESFIDESDSNTSVNNLEEDSETDEDMPNGSDSESDEVVSEKDNDEIDVKNDFDFENMKNAFEKKLQNKVRENTLEVDDSDIEDNVSEKDYESDDEDDVSEKNYDNKVQEDISEKINDSEVEENDFSNEDIDNDSMKNYDDDVNEDDSEKDSNVRMDSTFSKDVLLSSSIDSKHNKNQKTLSNKSSVNSFKTVKLPKETNKKHGKYINRTTAQTAKDIIKSSTKDHVKTISMLNLDDLEGLEEIPIEKMSDDEIDDDVEEEEQNLEEANDPFFLRSGEVASFTDGKPERNTFTQKHEHSKIAKSFDRNKNEGFKNKFGRKSNGNRGFNKERGFTKDKFQKNQTTKFNKNFQKSGFDHNKSFNRGKEFNKNSYLSKNQGKFQPKKDFLSRSSFNTEESGTVRTIDKQSFRDNSSFNRGKEFNKNNFKLKNHSKFQGQRKLSSESPFDKKRQGSFGKKMNKLPSQDSSSKIQFKVDHARSSFNNAKFQNKKGTETNDASLHPSWVAKRKQKELAQLSFQGKRMVFDD